MNEIEYYNYNNYSKKNSMKTIFKFIINLLFK